MRFIEPPDWAPASGYANGVEAEGRLLFVSGQIGWDPSSGELVGEGFVAQAAQTLRNIVAVLRAGGARPQDVARMTWYITDAEEYRAALRPLGVAYRELFGTHYPAMSVVVVAGLLEPGAKVEIEATAVLKNPSPIPGPVAEPQP